MRKKIQVAVASPPDRQELVVEISIDNEQIAELNTEHGTLSLEIYPRQAGSPWVIEYEELMQALKSAKKELVGKP